MPERRPYTIFARSGTSNFWIRYSLPGQKQAQHSLGTSDRAEAERKALDHYSEARALTRLGLTSHGKKFKAVAEDFLQLLTDEVAQGTRRKHQLTQYRGIIQRYFIGFFGEKSINDVDEVLINRFWEWRKAYWLTGAGEDITYITYERQGRSIRKPLGEKRNVMSRSEQRGEATLLRQLMRHAARRGWLKKSELPDIEVPSVPPNPRPGMTIAEFTLLQQTADDRLNDPICETHPNIYRSRQMLRCYVNIAGYTGCRPTELRTLNWSAVLDMHRYLGPDLRPLYDREQPFRIWVHGKKKERTLPVRVEARIWFHRARKLFIESVGREPNPEDPVFASPTGKRMGSIGKGLNQLLEACALKADRLGNTRTAYSFRHHFVTQLLLDKTNVYDVAKLTGTSSDMIDKHYGHTTVEQLGQMYPEPRPFNLDLGVYQDEVLKRRQAEEANPYDPDNALEGEDSVFEDSSPEPVVAKFRAMPDRPSVPETTDPETTSGDDLPKPSRLRLRKRRPISTEK